MTMSTVCDGLERSSNDLVINDLQEWSCSGIAWMALSGLQTCRRSGIID
jgi:hypothetical protein